jgi:hypothetical protein
MNWPAFYRGKFNADEALCGKEMDGVIPRGLAEVTRTAAHGTTESQFEGDPDQAVGGGLFSTGARAGESTVRTAETPGSASRRGLKAIFPAVGWGSTKANGRICRKACNSRTLRRQESGSAEFCTVSRSSVTEITGNRIRISTARATIWVRRSSPSRDPIRNHRHTRARATNAPMRLRISSKLIPFLFEPPPSV